MKTPQAGDKAVYHCTLTFKEIVNVLYLGEKTIRVQLIDGDKDIFHVAEDELSPVYIVRVLQDGRAREVNPLGSVKPEIYDYTNEPYESQVAQLRRWNEAESQCLTLPWTMQAGVTQKSHSDDLDKPWYALLFSDKFTLIKPADTNNY